MEGVNRRGWVPQISLNSSNSNSRHPSVLRDNGKTSLLGVENQRRKNIYRSKILQFYDLPLDQKILIPQPTKCDTVGNPLDAVALYGTHVLGLSQVAWSTVLP